MTDLEMTKLCAEAMGYRISSVKAYTPEHDALHISWEDEFGGNHMAFWCPLRVNEQAMDMVQRFCLLVEPPSRHTNDCWRVALYPHESRDQDLNRAIVECCARMQLAKVQATTTSEP